MSAGLIAGLVVSAVGSPTDDFLAAARAKHGTAGERAAQFLIEHMPPQDRETLTAEYLIDNLDLAFHARSAFPWAAAVPEALFLNDVLPYAVFDEPRDDWRSELYPLARDLVKQATTASEAAQLLNRELFNRINVHYNTGRKRPNQSYLESRESGRATCTGLSIILVNACRAVGIPARAVGTAMWTTKRGNHTWVEIWDGDWHFTGADEYDAAGLDRGWFVGDAAQARADDPRHAIYATSWKREGTHFPMVWARRSDVVSAVDVTARYAQASKQHQGSRLSVRLWDKPRGDRLVATIEVLDGTRQILHKGLTRAGTADLNDMPTFDLPAKAKGWLRFNREAETREIPFGPLESSDSTIDAVWSELAVQSAAIKALEEWVRQSLAERTMDHPALRWSLSRQEAQAAVALLAADASVRIAAERSEEMEAREFSLGGKTLRWTETIYGEPPDCGHSLWISMHGGGNAATAVNDRQWRNQGRLYKPAEGIYVAPRAPTDTWNLWHEGHIDPMFQRLIESYVAVRGVDQNRVYLMGYSAGGDGVWQLAPRMADRFAAAAMMAGHPNEAGLLGLRNLPFALFMGGNDRAYNRNTVAAQRAADLKDLAEADPGGYVHLARIYEGLGHWMNGQDAEALPWMASFTRNSWPPTVVWQQDDVVHRRFYWLQLPEDGAIGDRQVMRASANGQGIEVSGEVGARLCLRLADQLIDLDAPITVHVNGREVFQGTVQRQAAAIVQSLGERLDPPAAATAILCVE